MCIFLWTFAILNIVPSEASYYSQRLRAWRCPRIETTVPSNRSISIIYLPNHALSFIIISLCVLGSHPFNQETKLFQGNNHIVYSPPQGHLTQQLTPSRQWRIICGWLTLGFYNSVCGQVLVEFRKKKNSNLQSVLASGLCCSLPFFFMNCLPLQSPFQKRNGVGKSVVKQSYWHYQWGFEL